MFKHRCLFICLFFLSFACLLVCFRHFFFFPSRSCKVEKKKRAKCNNPKKKGRGTDSAHSKQAGEKKEHSIKEQLIFAFTTNSNEEVFCLRLCSTCRLVMCATGKKGKTERIRVLRAYAKGKRTCPPSPSCSMPFFLLLLFLCVCFFEICIKLFPKTVDRIGGTRTAFSCIFLFVLRLFQRKRAHLYASKQTIRQQHKKKQKTVNYFLPFYYFSTLHSFFRRTVVKAKKKKL